MNSRRQFLSQLTKASLLACIPFETRELFFGSSKNPELRIEAVDILKVSGPYTRTPGFNEQYQVQPMHIYPDARPQPYRDTSDPREESGTLTHHYLRIRTRGGIEGFYGYIDPETVTPILQQIGPMITGEDANAVETIWDKLYRSNRHSRAGYYMMALSAIDNALWDVRGKYFGVPVYELLGGPTRKEVPMYGSCLGYSAEPGKAGPRAKLLFDSGFVNQKWFLPYGPGSGNKGMELNIRLVKELREAVGWDCQLMFDAFMGWDLPYAVTWSKAVEAYRPSWIEEAFPPNRLENYVELSRSTSIPVATGEHFYNRWEVRQFLDAGAIQIVQADPEWCGGVSELIKICHLASSYGLQVIPHGHNIHAALHVVASQSPETCPMSEYLIRHVPGKVHFQKDPLVTENGIIQVPQSPGFGIEPDPSKIEHEEVLSL